MTESCPHLTDELLAEHGAVRLPVQHVPAVFEHLLVCDSCNERYEAELNFEHGLQEAFAKSAAEQPSQKRSWLSTVPVSMPACGAFAAIALAILFVPYARRNSGHSQVIDLSAVRGGQEATLLTDRPVELRLAATGLDPSPTVRVQIADDSGQEVWQGKAELMGYIWKVRPATRLRPARYWVRVLGTNPPHAHLREYSFKVR